MGSFEHRDATASQTSALRKVAVPLVYIVHICGRVYARYPIAPTSNWEQHEEFISRSYANPNAKVMRKQM